MLYGRGMFKNPEFMSIIKKTGLIWFPNQKIQRKILLFTLDLILKGHFANVPYYSFRFRLPVE